MKVGLSSMPWDKSSSCVTCWRESLSHSILIFPGICIALKVMFEVSKTRMRGRIMDIIFLFLEVCLLMAATTEELSQ